MGNFNDWSHKTAVPMTKNADGTYSAVVNSKSDTVVYRLIKIAKGDAVEGTEANSYQYNKYDGYNSIILSNSDKVKIVFDPAKLIKSSALAEVTFSDSASLIAQFAIAYRRILSVKSAVFDAYWDYVNSGKYYNFKYDFSKDLESLNADMKSVKNNVIKDELLFDYLELWFSGAKIDTSLIRQAFNKIPPSSNLWSLNPYLADAILNHLGVGKQKYEEYMNQLVSDNKSSVVKSNALFDLLRSAKSHNEDDEAFKYYNILIDQYSNTIAGINAKNISYINNIHVKIGSPVPAFSFVSLDDSAKVVTNESLIGKYYLIDFWAIWCGQCVWEIKYLEKACEKYKDKNFIIVSVAVGNTGQEVSKFRNEKWKMPWFNSVIPGSKVAEIQKEFDFLGIPVPILVNDKGIVVALQEDLRHENLDQTLVNLLSK